MRYIIKIIFTYRKEGVELNGVVAITEREDENLRFIGMDELKELMIKKTGLTFDENSLNISGVDIYPEHFKCESFYHWS